MEMSVGKYYSVDQTVIIVFTLLKGTNRKACCCDAFLLRRGRAAMGPLCSVSQLPLFQRFSQ